MQTNITILSCNYNANDRLQPAIESWAQSAGFMQNANVGKVSLYITDNNSKDGSKDYLTNLSKNPDPRFDSCKIFLNDVNCGKAKAVNEMAKIALQDANSTLLMLIDSDIRICQPEMLAIACEIGWVTKDKVSAMVCWQTGNSLFKRHFQWTKTVKENLPEFNYFVPNEGFGSGIAGGAMFLWNQDWINVGGFRENMGKDKKPSIYGSNDGCLLFDAFSRTNRPIMVIKELEVYHPPEVDLKYQAWKDSLHREHIQYGHSITEKGFFD